ncbi:transmembrane protein 237-like isoform X2 [Bombus flavifrons]
MNRTNERVLKRRSNPEVTRRNDSSSSEESSSVTESTEYSPYVQNTSTPLRPRWTNSEEINRFRRGQGEIDDAEEVSSDKKGSKKFQRRKEHVDRKRYQDNRERIVEKQRGGHDRRNKRRHDRRSEDAANKRRKETSSSESSDKSYNESDLERSKRKKRDLVGDNELPITEILRRSQENARTKYEHQVPLPVLTTDKVYVQHRGGFSTMKINQTKGFPSDKKTERASVDIRDEKNSPPIKVAIMLQQFWKNTGVLYQGLLGGMALTHFIMLHVFFNNSIEFIAKYSPFSEIYTNIFSFLIAMCIVSTFDKFDLARFDVEHLRELYFDYNKAMIAVPLYLVVFCLHQIGAGTDDQLNLIHYYNSNHTVWQNVTNVQSLLDDLNSWQRISMSKDLLAVFAWLFVSLGTKDDSFLTYLQSMEKYADDIESSRRS